MIVIIGVALVLYAVGWPILGVAGARATGSITHVRRQGGERNETVAGRYTWIVAYRFTAEDGRAYHGSTQRVGGYGGPDNRPSGAIRYLPQFPHVNAPQEDTRLSVVTGILLFAGVAMVFPGFWRRKKAKKRSRR